MKIRIWLVTREPQTWIAGAEIVALALLLLWAVDSPAVRVLGLVVLAHLGYTALTGLPMGRIPGRPLRGRPRRNLDLRAQVVTFLREVRRVDDYAQSALLAGWPVERLQAGLRAGEQRVMAAAARVAEVTTHPTTAPDESVKPARRHRLSLQRTRATQT